MNKAQRRRRVEAAKSNYRQAPASDRQYIAWLMERRGFDLQGAIAYATLGNLGLETLRAVPRARTKPELAAARETDKGEDRRRWERIQRPCPRRGCLLPIHHSGPHKGHAVDFERADSLDEFERRFADAPPPLYDALVEED